MGNLYRIDNFSVTVDTYAKLR